MSVVRITAPIVAPIDTEAAKRVLGVDDADVEDDDIQLLIDAATGQIDGPTGWLGRALIQQTLELRLDGFCDEIPLPYPPFIAVLSIKYDDANGAEQTLNASNYRVIGGDRPVLVRSYAGTWPSARSQAECVRIRYTCGYGTKGTDVPAKARKAIKLMVKELYGLGDRDLTISAETEDGIGSTQYVVSENAAKVMRGAVESLLSGLVVYS